MDEREIRAVAERIARRLDEERPAPADDLSALRAALAKIEQRLARIEARIEARSTPAVEPASPIQTTQAAEPVRSSQRASSYISHPSQERFEVGEAVAELVDFLQREKICNLEPGGKPCDHCAMCSARGF
ncbi:MAG: hypothetical protein C4334_02080 [Pyrinomonas sp.]